MRYHRGFVVPIVFAGFLLRSAAVAGAGAPAEGARAVHEIGTGWRFQIDANDLGEGKKWYDQGFDRSGWAKVEVPKAWDLFEEALKDYEGIGWYSVTLGGPWGRPGTVQRLKFGRVMYHTKVWLNGEFLGEQTDGYLPFEFDVTGKLRGSANHLVLRVDNRPRIEWLPAGPQIEWVQYGGILQPVTIETTAPVFLSDLAIRAVPKGDRAELTCLIEISARKDADDLVLRVGVAGNERATRTVPLVLRAGTTSRQLVLSLERAAEWSPESPVLHELAATIEKEGATIDRLRSSFGVRVLEARGRQLLLNGKPLKIRGVNRYDEYGRFGPNPPEPLVVGELRLMKRVGINLIRTHYPQSPELIALYDRMGFLLMEELPLCWWGSGWLNEKGPGQDEAILEQALPMLERMIQRDRNHPSLVMWSLANESKTDSDVGIRVMKKLIARTKELDPSRLVTFVVNSRAEAHRAFADADLVAFNMYPGQMRPPIATHIGQFDDRVRKDAEASIKRQLAAFPDKPAVVSEFGAKGISGLSGDVPGTEDFQAAYIRSVWEAIAGAPELSGGIVWCWADYHHRRSFHQNGPFGSYGVVTTDRRPKAALEDLGAIFGGEEVE